MGDRLGMSRTLALIAALTVALSACSGQSDSAPAPQARGSCPVTLPNGDTPPGESPNPHYHGNGALWTSLWPYGTIVVGAEDVREDGSIAMKFWWWRGVEGQLTIEGRRLDATAPPLRADIPSGYGLTDFQASAIIFSSEGCWEVTGRVGDASLTFTVIVVSAERGL